MKGIEVGRERFQFTFTNVRNFRSVIFRKPVASSRKSPTPNVSFRLKFSDLWENPEVVLTKMAPSTWLSRAAVWIPEFLLSKFPYIQGVTLIMLLAERALKAEK